MGVNFKTALEIAEKNYPHSINHYEEYNDYFVFDYDNGAVRVGGELSPIVICKKDGQALNYAPIFFDLSENAKDVGEIISEGTI